MGTGGKRLRWAAGIMLALGAGHLVLATAIAADSVGGWADRGVWAAVPLLPEAGEPTVETVRNSAAFWAGPGSFAVPLILLGALTWHLARRGVPVPAGIGWGLAAWCLLGGILLVPSPYFAGVVAGALIISTARERS